MEEAESMVMQGALAPMHLALLSTKVHHPASPTNQGDAPPNQGASPSPNPDPRHKKCAECLTEAPLIRFHSTCYDDYYCKKCIQEFKNDGEEEISETPRKPSEKKVSKVKPERPKKTSKAPKAPSKPLPWLSNLQLCQGCGAPDPKFNFKDHPELKLCQKCRDKSIAMCVKKDHSIKRIMAILRLPHIRQRH